MQNAAREAARDAMGNETLQTQFEEVKEATTKSHVTQFGNIPATTQQPIGDYEGDLNNNKTAARIVPVKKKKKKDDEKKKKRAAAAADVDVKTRSAVNQRDASLVGAFYAYVESASAAVDARPAHRARLAEALVAMVRGREAVDALFAGLVRDYALGASAAADAVPLARAHLSCKRAFDEAVRTGPCGTNADGSLSYAAEYALKHSAHALRACAAEGGKFTPRLAAKIAKLSC